MKAMARKTAAFLLIVSLAGCGVFGKGDIFRDPNMDFGSIKTVAVLPLVNLSREQSASERVRDVLNNKLFATGAVYVLPDGEIARGISRAGLAAAASPSIEEVKKLGSIIQANAVITGVVREYGEVRSGSASANVISLSFQMFETQTGKVVWTASTTQGGLTASDRLFGGGGHPLNDITEKAVNEIIEKLF